MSEHNKETKQIAPLEGLKDEPASSATPASSTPREPERAPEMEPSGDQCTAGSTPSTSQHSAPVQPLLQTSGPPSPAAPAIASVRREPAAEPTAAATLATLPDEARDAEVERQIRQKSRRSFLVGGTATLGAIAAGRWLVTRRPDDGIPWPFRRALEVNEQLARDYFRDSHLAQTFPRSAAGTPRENGDEGLSEDFDPTAWRLAVRTVPGPDQPLTLALDDIKALPRVEQVTELRCIEGWREIVYWAGARLADFAARYSATAARGSDADEDEAGARRKLTDFRYVSLETPDQGYYVGLDMASGLHPQTLLCYEMNGEALTPAHGAPLRLVIPSKYGIKNIKRIGTIRFTNVRPTDYWFERGYDWYAGL